MADKSFGVKELNLLNASGTPTVTSPNNLNLNANTVAISTSCTIGNNLTITSTTTSANLNISGIATVVNFNATGISTIAQPADSNPMANWTITNNSASAYRFTGPGQSGTEDNPNIYLVRGHRYIFRHNATSSHPIQIRFANGGTAYTDGITYSEGNNTTTDGNNLIFNVQHDAPAQLFYQCTSHGGMVGNIYIIGGPQVISGVVTATTFVGNLTGNVTGTSSANAVLTGSTNNQLVTVTGANAITGESALTFDGNNFNFTRATSGDARMYIYGGEGGDARLLLASDEGDDHIDTYEIRAQASDNALAIYQFESGSYVQRIRIANGGKIVLGNSTTSTTQLDIRFTDTTTYSASSNHVNGLKIFNDSNTDNGFAGIELAATDGDDYYGSTLLKSIADGTNYTNDFAIQTRIGGNYAERLRIDSSGDVNVKTGNLVIGTSGKGIDFHNYGSGTNISSNLLDDYEEGSAVPDFANADNSIVTVDRYTYTKVGRLVHFEAKFTVGSNNDGSGFGFTLPVAQGGSRETVIPAISTRSGTTTTPFAFVVNANQSYAYAKALDGFSSTNCEYVDFAGDIILVSGTYEST